MAIIKNHITVVRDAKAHASGAYSCATKPQRAQWFYWTAATEQQYDKKTTHTHARKLTKALYARAQLAVLFINAHACCSAMRAHHTCNALIHVHTSHLFHSDHYFRLRRNPTDVHHQLVFICVACVLILFLSFARVWMRCKTIIIIMDNNTNAQIKAHADAFT